MLPSTVNSVEQILTILVQNSNIQVLGIISFQAVKGIFSENLKAF